MPHTYWSMVRRPFGADGTGEDDLPLMARAEQMPGAHRSPPQRGHASRESHSFHSILWPLGLEFSPCAIGLRVAASAESIEVVGPPLGSRRPGPDARCRQCPTSARSQLTRNQEGADGPRTMKS